MQYYPCIFDNRSGHIIKQVTERSMTREAAENYLKRHYLMQWRSCDAIPQPVTHTGLIPAWHKSR